MVEIARTLKISNFRDIFRRAMMCGIPVLKLQELSLFWWISSMVLPVSSPWRSTSSAISQWNDVNHPTIPKKFSFGSYIKSTNGKVRTWWKFQKNNFYTSWILRGGSHSRHLQLCHVLPESGFDHTVLCLWHAWRCQQQEKPVETHDPNILTETAIKIMNPIEKTVHS